MEPKHSGLGIASFAISILAGFLMFATVVIAGVLQIRTPGGLDDEAPVTIFIGLAIIGLVLLDLLAFVLGVAGLFQKNVKKVFAILGLILSGLTIVGIIALIVIGSAL